MEHIIHSIEPVFDTESRVLILGTMPSPKSREVQFYYGHPQNRFWRVLAAVLGEEVVGFAGMQQVLDEGYITNIAVAESCRRQGLGRAMLGALIDHCRESGASFLTLEVRQANAPAIALYESMGFLPEGRRKNFYRQPTEDAILMTKRDLSL